MFHLPSLAVVVWGLGLEPGKSKPREDVKAEGRNKMELFFQLMDSV